MEDQQIIDLYWQRNTQAIDVTEEKYGGQLQQMAENLLEVHEDAEECVNDTYLQAWNAIPPNRPAVFSAFIGKIVRNLALDRYRKRNAGKRGGGELTLALEELYDCASDTSVEGSMEQKDLSRLISGFIRSLPRQEGDIFICRYWYLDPVKEIAQQFSISESKVKNTLFRTRKKLKAVLLKEGIVVE